MGAPLFEMVGRRHAVRLLPDGHTQLFVALHLVHEVTSPQAFGILERLGLPVAYPDRTFATVDHVLPTDTRRRPLADGVAEGMVQALEAAAGRHGFALFGDTSEHNGIVHVMAPELGLTQPGMTIACGDSHTSTLGAFGAVAFGIGTSQVRDVLATQTVRMAPLKVRKIELVGQRPPGISAKDLILFVIRELGAEAGAGYAYELAGPVVEGCSMEERMTLCNMAIEAGARVAYVNPDPATFEYLKGRPYAPQGAEWGRSVERWRSFASDPDARFDDVRMVDVSGLEPMVTWGTNPSQAIPISQTIPRAEGTSAAEIEEALRYMQLRGGEPIEGVRVDVAFIGSCTNGRISDLRDAARVLRGRRVASGVRAIVAPGSAAVARQARAEGLDSVFTDAGFEWRMPGCSMCLAMNPDRLKENELCASTSNRNFKGRQDSPTGRTVLMSPAMVAAAAVQGCVCDVRHVISE